jgi:cysteine desulfurase / selenocysteine lyase
MPPRRIYLDNAATSWPKPPEVYSAVDHYLRTNGAPAGRSGYREAIEIAHAIASARVAVARLIGASDSKQIIFTTNGTDSLNLAIQGLLRPGDHAICTAADHNSVLRPLRHLQRSGVIEVTRVPCDSKGLVDPEAIRSVLRGNTRLIAMPHASNVTGVIEPVAEVGAISRNHGARFLVDAAQTLGHVRLSVTELDADLVAGPAHKGLLAPLGTGVLYIRQGVELELESVRQGGTGSNSEVENQPDSLPDKYEAGNLNVPGIVGLAAALRWLQEQDLDSIFHHDQELTGQLRAGFESIPGVKVYGHHTTDPGNTVGVVSITIEGYDPQEAAGVLDSAFGVQVRAGLHCAPNIHRAMGTMEQGGAIRFSIGAFNSAEDIAEAVAAVRRIASGA